VVAWWLGSTSNLLPMELNKPLCINRRSPCFTCTLAFAFLHLLWCVARTWCHVYALFKPFIHVKAHISQQMSFYYLNKSKDVLVYFIILRKFKLETIQYVF
jgi:hypothetical protein